MLVQDTTASVAVLTTATEDKRALRRTRKLEQARLDVLEARVNVHAVVEALRTLERGREEGRAIRATRADLERERKRLANREARVRALEHDSQPVGTRRGESRTYRLQSSRHQVDWAEKKFTKLSVAQRREPVWVTSRGDRSWWWYRDRFWWADARPRSHDVREWVLDRDFEALLLRQSTDSVLAAFWQVPAGDASTPPISDEARRKVWMRDAGCCVDCGSVDASVFSLIRPIEEGGSYVALNLELRCRACEARRRDNMARARVDRAHDAASGRYPEKLRRMVRRRDPDRARRD
jgi:hypothetical protein